MARPRVYKTEAIVLKKVNLGEADCILTLCTPHLGKIRAVARGIRRPKSRLAGHLDLLTRSALLIAQGKTFDIVTQSQTIESFASLKGDLKHIACCLYIAELVDQFSAEEAENYAIYSLLNEHLQWLCEARDCNLVLRHFELGLLSMAGYQPELYKCAGCGSDLAPVRNVFSPSSGGVLCSSCGSRDYQARHITTSALKVLRFLLTSNAARAERLRLDSELASEVKYLVRGYIRYMLERDIKSQEFLDSVEEAA